MDTSNSLNQQFFADLFAKLPLAGPEERLEIIQKLGEQYTYQNCVNYLGYINAAKVFVSTSAPTAFFSGISSALNQASAYLPFFSFQPTDAEMQKDKALISKRKREEEVVDPNKHAPKKPRIELSKVKIIHIGQVHALPFDQNPPQEFMNIVIRCQISIGQYIMKNPNFLVVKESLKTDYTDLLQFPSWVDGTKKLFPKGFPDNIDDMNELQKKFLYNEGAVYTLFFLGMIPCIYKSIHEDAAEYVKNNQNSLEKIATNPEINYNLREEEAIKCIKELVIKKDMQTSSNGDITILLVYGAAHDFKPYCTREGFESEFIDHSDEFRAFYKKISLANK